jgi:hypothetical protein
MMAVTIRVWITVLAVAATAMAVTGQTPSASPPALTVDAPDRLSAVAAEVRGFDRGRLVSVMTLTGLSEPGPPIRVLLLPEDSPVARETPSWVAGFADPKNDAVVLFPERIGVYPFGSLEGVLYHEVAHILIARATNGGRVPRWFNEGLARAAERSWNLQDQSRLAWELVIGSPVTATELEGLFNQGADGISRAYVLSDALVRDILARYGPQTAARVLARMREGAPFDLALLQETGASVRQLTLSFWSRHAVWERWIAFIGHPYTLWIFVTLLAIIAIWKHRRKRRKRRVQWELEERAEEQTWEEHRRKYRVH